MDTHIKRQTENSFSFSYHFVMPGAKLKDIQVFLHQEDGKPKKISINYSLDPTTVEKIVSYTLNQDIDKDTYDTNPVLVLDSGILNVIFQKTQFPIHKNETINLTRNIIQR